MSKKKRFGVSQALSRGLSETIHVVENNVGGFRNVILPLSRIELDPNNPRKLAISLADIRNGIAKDAMDYERKLAELERIKELAATIESSGVINPIVVYKRGDLYRVVAGERRCLASILIGKEDIDARVFNEKPKALDLKLIQWIENTAREDLTLDERIGNILEIIKEYQNQHGNMEITASRLKEITGLSLPQCTYYLAVINAEEDVQQAISAGKIKSLDKAAVIAGIKSSELRTVALQACINGCSLKELRKIISYGKASFESQTGQKPKKPGKAISKVNMGFTVNPAVVQRIVQTVLNNELQTYTNLFANIKWDRHEHAAKAFKKMVDILEDEIGK